MKRNLATFILIVIFIGGILLLAYPVICDYWNSFTNSVAIGTYMESMGDMENGSYVEELDKARAFNEKIYQRHGIYALSDEEQAEYDSLLNVSGNGVMGYIDIPSIKTTLVIHHGMEESSLKEGAGHMEYTSLPVGGINTHSGISGHRGLLSARLFSDLNRLVEGDTFKIHVLDETLTYEVDKIMIVEPKETRPLLPEKGQDLCTLVTCTPYGINTHRLLVRGHRVENSEDYSKRITADGRLIDPTTTAPFMAMPMLLILVVWLFVRY